MKRSNSACSERELPQTPLKIKTPTLLSPLTTPPKSAIKCLRCDAVLTGNHDCSLNNKILHSSLSFPCSPSVLGPPKLSPIGKRSFDTWSESEYDEDGESSPCKMERLDSFYDEGDQMKVHLFDENEIINLPTSDKSSNKYSIHLQARTRPRKNSGLRCYGCLSVNRYPTEYKKIYRLMISVNNASGFYFYRPKIIK
jgi:uncharacterized C2H2 Zn-finger protein